MNPPALAFRSLALAYGTQSSRIEHIMIAPVQSQQQKTPEQRADVKEQNWKRIRKIEEAVVAEDAEAAEKVERISKQIKTQIF